MTTQDTSRESWNLIRQSAVLGERQRECFTAFMEMGGKGTQRDVDRWWRNKHPGVTPTDRVLGKRVPELEQMGVIEHVGTVYDSDTERSLNWYVITGRMPTRLPPQKPAAKAAGAVPVDADDLHREAVNFACSLGLKRAMVEKRYLEWRATGRKGSV
jgi:hypothetical protein